VADLDTLIDEPPAADSPFRSMPKVAITPHAGSDTRAALGAAAAVGNVLRALRSEAVDRRLCINPDVLDGKDKRQ
jgi:D-3-phosphoglycerate dehydrogenase